MAATIRLDAQVADAFKVEGRGWQTRMNRALACYLSQGPAPSAGGAKLRDARTATAASDGGSKTAAGTRSQKP